MIIIMMIIMNIIIIIIISSSSSRRCARPRPRGSFGLKPAGVGPQTEAAKSVAAPEVVADCNR